MFDGSFFGWLLDAIWNSLVDFLNAVIAGVSSLFTIFLNMLPDAGSVSGISAPTDPTAVQDFLGYANWFLPLNHIVASIGLYITATLLYFGIGPLLRWVKVIK